MIEIQPKVFFFDFDGVIVDSERLHMWATLEALQNKPNFQFDEDYYFEHLLGFDDIGIFEFLWNDKKQKITPEELKEAMQKKNSALMQRLKEGSYFFPGVLDFIRSFKEKNIPIAIVSGALRKEILPCIEKAKITERFEFIVAADDVRHSKPDPESYEKAYHHMLEKNIELNPEDCWVIEDSPAGIASAKGAGLNVIGITNSLKKEALSQADFIVSHYSEIKIL